MAARSALGRVGSVSSSVWHLCSQLRGEPVLVLLLPSFRLFHLSGELGLFEGRALEASIASIASLRLLQPTEKVGRACELIVSRSCSQTMRQTDYYVVK